MHDVAQIHLIIFINALFYVYHLKFSLIYLNRPSLVHQLKSLKIIYKVEKIQMLYID